MIEYFKEQEPDFITHLQQEFPYEGVGLIINDKYYPCDNVAENPDENFIISTQQYKQMRELGDIQAVIHSHNDYPHISKNDMTSQMQTLVPYCMVSLKNKSIQRIVWWGDSLQPQELLNRYFVHGVYDCYGLLRDFFRHHGIVLPNFVRENLWWLENEALFEENLESVGVYSISKNELKPGDIILMKIRGSHKHNHANHCGIYVGEGLLLHHLYNRASRVEPVGGWGKMITQYLRLPEFDGITINKGLLQI